MLSDCFFATYWLFANAWDKEFDLIVKAHHRRKIDFRRGIKLGPLDQIISYAKPNQRPYWMTPEEYAAAPDYIFVRHLRYQVYQKGFALEQLSSRRPN